MEENSGVGDRNGEFWRRNRVDGDSFRYVEFEVMVGSQSRDMLEVQNVELDRGQVGKGGVSDQDLGVILQRRRLKTSE